MGRVLEGLRGPREKTGRPSEAAGRVLGFEGPPHPDGQMYYTVGLRSNILKGPVGINCRSKMMLQPLYTNKKKHVTEMNENIARMRYFV